jgi:hypothetical protein
MSEGALESVGQAVPLENCAESGAVAGSYGSVQNVVGRDFTQCVDLASSKLRSLDLHCAHLIATKQNVIQ